MSWLFPAQAFTGRPARTSPGAPPKANQLAKSAAALSATSHAASSDCCSALTTHRSVHQVGRDFNAPPRLAGRLGGGVGTRELLLASGRCWRALVLEGHVQPYAVSAHLPVLD